MNEYENWLGSDDENAMKDYVLSALRHHTALDGAIWEDVINTYGWLGECVDRAVKVVSSKLTQIDEVFFVDGKCYSIRLNKCTRPRALTYWYERPDQTVKENDRR